MLQMCTRASFNQHYYIHRESFWTRMRLFKKNGIGGHLMKPGIGDFVKLLINKGFNIDDTHHVFFQLPCVSATVHVLN